MAENRDEILANFQSITGIDDVAEAFNHLEENDWDLMATIAQVMPQDVPSLRPSTSLNFRTPEFPRWWSAGTEDNAFRSGPSSLSSADNVVDLTAENDSDSRRSASNVLTFNIHFNQNIYTIRIPSHSTVGDLKHRINDKTNVPFCRQVLRGWPPEKLNEAQNSSSVLANLGLSSENELVLIDLTEEGFMDDESNSEIERRNNETFTLNIVQQPEGKTLQLMFPGRQTVLDVKTGVHNITNIPVRYQDWTGWPPGVIHSTTLAQSGIEVSHNFILRSTAPTDRPTNSRALRANNIVVDSDSSAEEFEDASDFNADDDMFTETSVTSRPKHLIPDQTDNEHLGSELFVKNYIQRYGTPHPIFFEGTLQEAINEACHKPAKDRRLLAIYLHHDDSVLTNVFCDQLLRCENVMHTLLLDFLLYGWDLTFESNKNLFLSSLNAFVGPSASISVRNIPVDKLPAIMIIGKYRSSMDVISVINGNIGVDDLLSRLMEAAENNKEQLLVEVKEENDRAEREQVKYEQDMAYQLALEADQAKEAAKLQKEMSLAAERKRLESEKAEQDAAREANRLQAEQALPPEPADGDGVTKIRVRRPTGDFIERNFTIKSTLRDLLNFVASKGFPISEYKAISSWPRRDLTTLNPDETLETLKLYPRETVIVEER